jgi:translation initiation factor 5
MILCSMPLLTTKIEGKGNGIKTVIPNMSDVARALSRPPTYTTKFFGCELGAQTSFDEKNDRYIVNGAHNADRLRELLDVFIDKFVLCKSCKNPETELIILKVNRTEDIIRDCKACGERTGVDMRHKLTTFIVRNPPVKIKKGKNKNTGDAAGGVSGGGNPDHTVEHDESLENGGAESDDELSRKIKAEAKDLTSTGLGDDDGSDDDVNSPYGQLGLWITENKDEDAIARSLAIYKKAENLGIEKKHKTVTVVVQALFTENMISEIDKYTGLLAKVLDSYLLRVHV